MNKISLKYITNINPLDLKNIITAFNIFVKVYGLGDKSLSKHVIDKVFLKS